MRDVVVDGDVFAHHLLADAIGEAGALIEHGGSGEIVEEKAHEIEDGGRFENYGPSAGLDFFGVARSGSLFTGALGERFGDRSGRDPARWPWPSRRNPAP